MAHVKNVGFPIWKSHTSNLRKNNYEYVKILAKGNEVTWPKEAIEAFQKRTDDNVRGKRANTVLIDDKQDFVPAMLYGDFVINRKTLENIN